MGKDKGDELFEESLNKLSDAANKKNAEPGDKPCINGDTPVFDSPSVKDREGAQPNRELENQDSFAIKKLLSALEDDKQNRELRKQVSSQVYAFLVVWCAVVLCMVIASACKDSNFLVPEKIQLTLVGGTTVSTIGLVSFIVKGLFPSDSGKDNKGKKKSKSKKKK